MIDMMNNLCLKLRNITIVRGKIIKSRYFPWMTQVSNNSFDNIDFVILNSLYINLSSPEEHWLETSQP